MLDLLQLAPYVVQDGNFQPVAEGKDYQIKSKFPLPECRRTLDLYFGAVVHPLLRHQLEQLLIKHSSYYNIQTKASNDYCHMFDIVFLLTIEQFHVPFSFIVFQFLLKFILRDGAQSCCIVDIDLDLLLGVYAESFDDLFAG